MITFPKGPTMEDSRTPKPIPCDRQEPHSCTGTVQTDNTETHRPPDAAKSEGDPIPENSHSTSHSSVEQLGKQLEDVSNAIKNCYEKLSHLACGIDELRAADQIIKDLSTRYRDLNERFYER